MAIIDDEDLVACKIKENRRRVVTSTFGKCPVCGGKAIITGLETKCVCRNHDKIMVLRYKLLNETSEERVAIFTEIERLREEG